MANVYVTYARLEIADADICNIPPEILGCEECMKSAYPGNPPTNLSTAPIRYATGEPIIRAADLPGVNGFGMPWGQNRTFASQLPSPYNMGVGMNWQTSEESHLALEFDDATYDMGGLSARVIRSTRETLIYNQISTLLPYESEFRTGERLTFDPRLHKQSYTLHKVDGSAYHYIGLNGMLGAYEDARGNRMEVIEWIDSGFLPRKVQRTCETPDGTATETIEYKYPMENVPSPQLIWVTVHRINPDSSGTWVSKALYTYYGTGDEFGGHEDLKSVTIQTWQNHAWVTTGTYYYRYWTGSDSQPGHAVKFVLEPGSFERLAADPDVTDPFTAPDSIVAQYADYFYLYDSQRRVIREDVQSGSQTYEFSYENSFFTPDFNHWFTKTTETLPDGNQNIIYSNYAGQTMLKVFVSGTSKWCEYTRFDEHGQAVLFANPAAVIGYDDTFADLLDYDSGTNTSMFLRSHDGLIRAITYHSESCYVATEGIRKGQSGTLIPQRKLEYCCATNDCDCSSPGHSSATLGTDCDSGVWFVASETVYPSETDPGQTEVTSYCRTFYPFVPGRQSYGVKELVTTFPAVSTDHNGSSVAATRRDYFDTYGYLIWSMDERGFITRMVYDVPTGTMTQLVVDVDTSLYSDVPDGWSTPSGGGKNLVADFTSDPQGRIIRSLGPAFLDATDTSVRTASWSAFYDDSHITLSAPGYVSTSGATLVNPVSITKADAGGRINEQIQAFSTLTDGSLPEILHAYTIDTRCGTDPTFGSSPLCGFPQSSYVRWTTFQYTDCCLTTSQRTYHTIPSTGVGTVGTNYDLTSYGYDAMKRRNHSVTPGGTITDLVYDPRGFLLSTYVGTNDTGATETDPTGGGTDPANNMVLVTSRQYDHGTDGGDGNLTQLTQYVDGSTTRVTCMIYDFRNRRIGVDGEVDFYQQDYYDNFSRVVRSERYDTIGPAGGCGSTSSGSLDSSSSSGSADVGNLIARSDVKYDARGNVYQAIRYAVDPATGDVGSSLVGNAWYDASGNRVKVLPAGSHLFSKTTYDSLGRVEVKYQGYDLDESSYADAFTVTDDVILEQVETTYDTASHAVQVTLRQRYHNAPDTQTGSLHSPGTTPKARVSYQAAWYDGVGRSVATADYGTHGGTTLSRPDAVPASSDSVLVGQIVYDPTGPVQYTIDPAGMVTSFEYDQAGRRITVIENNVGSSSSSSSSSSTAECVPSDDANRTTLFTYTADGQQATLTAVNDSTTDQTTTWTYGTTLSTADVASSLLLRSVAYPDSASSSDRLSYSYNRQGERTTLTDQRGCVHTYHYDSLGRPIHDCVTTLGSGVDGAIRRLSTTFEARGLPLTLSSYDNASVTAGTLVNQVRFAYNAFSQLVSDSQSHGGPVIASSTPQVSLSYADGSGNTIRPTALTYPDGRVLSYDYGTTDGINDAVSRVGSLIDDGLEESPLVEYSYLGLMSPVIVNYPEPDVKYTLASLTGTNDPDTGDLYSGVDRFGRVKDARWYSSGSTADVARLQYGYDRDSNRIWRADLVAQSLGKDFDELYGYDGLQRLQEMQRGELSSGHTSISSQNFAQCWRLDSTSNWQEFKEAASGTTLTLAQERHSNTVNEITSITRTVGPFWATPSYDAAGNTTTIPKPDNPAAVYGGTYDAWNRLVKLNILGTSETVQEHRYDARNFRTVRKNYSSGTLSETRHFYYTPGWQVLEERLGTTPDSAAPDRHFVWGLRYIDDLVLRERDTDLDGRLDERLYSLQDANWNVVALINPSGAAEERYQYTPFGTPIILTGSMSAVRSSSAVGMEVLFTGQRFEELTKLHLFRMRWFDSLTGRFIGRDPLGYPDGMNAYAAWFVPDGADPMGEWEWPVLEIGAGKPGRWAAWGTYGIKTGSPSDAGLTAGVNELGGGVTHLGRTAIELPAIAVDVTSGLAEGQGAITGLYMPKVPTYSITGEAINNAFLNGATYWEVAGPAARDGAVNTFTFGTYGAYKAFAYGDTRDQQAVLFGYSMALVLAATPRISRCPFKGKLPSLPETLDVIPGDRPYTRTAKGLTPAELDFFTGIRSAEAARQANSRGRQVLNQTMDSDYETWLRGLPEEHSKPLWALHSAVAAHRVTGPTHWYHPRRWYPDAEKVWSKVEFPIISKRNVEVIDVPLNLPPR